MVEYIYEFLKLFLLMFLLHMYGCCAQTKKLDFKHVVDIWFLYCIKIAERVETSINRSILIYCLVGKCPLPALNGHHHKRSINVLSVRRLWGNSFTRWIFFADVTNLTVNWWWLSNFCSLIIAKIKIKPTESHLCFWKHSRDPMLVGHWRKSTKHSRNIFKKSSRGSAESTNLIST
jgi:hypothetical protein